jgi:hypothetical protein
MRTISLLCDVMKVCEPDRDWRSALVASVRRKTRPAAAELEVPLYQSCGE